MNSPEAAEKNKPEISAIITCYFEEATIDEFHSRLSKTLNSLGRAYEIIFVNDGSTDKTFDKLKAIFNKDPNVTVVMDLFKNAGQIAAITAGITRARGGVLLFLDSDLQLDPEELPLLLAEYGKGSDLVTGYRLKRRDSYRRIIPSMIANIIMRKISRSNIRDFGCTFKLFNAKLIRAFELGPYKPIQLPFVISKARSIAEVPVTHHPRRVGQSGWTFKKLFSYNMDNFIGYSEIPFQILGVLSVICAILFFMRIALMYVLDVRILAKITNGLILNMILLCFLATLGVLAAIGEFTIRCFHFLNRHPVYIIREILEK